MNLIDFFALVIAGITVGFINTLAGGGSTISLSVLMLMGLSPAMANGTNRIGIAIQNIVGVGSFKQQGVLDTRKGLYLAIPATIGSVLGAYIAVDLNEAIFEKAMGVILLVMLVFTLFNPQKLIQEQTQLVNKPLNWKQYLLFFFIGVYGGFIHVGIGYFLLASLIMGAGYELVKANAVKVLIVLLYTPFSLAVFIWNDMIDYKMGFTLAIGTAIGAFIASRMAVKRGAGFVRWVIVVVIILTAAHLFGIVDFGSVFQKA
ncbi:MAG: sulfite exporter TauE/SafE family protein [Bacteroidetes bacterium]|nr:MAG: sulfite exporter TauE/SafE family protein [Bacteroidota bacterium]